VGGGFHLVGKYIGHLHQALLGVLRRVEVYLRVPISYYLPMQALTQAEGCYIVNLLQIPNLLLILGWG
jgi:hypothetical protein